LIENKYGLESLDKLLVSQMPEQLLMLNFGERINTEIIEKAIDQASRRTNRACVMIGEVGFEQSAILEIARKFHIKYFCVKQRLQPGPGQKKDWGVIRYQPPIERSDTALRFQQIAKDLGNDCCLTAYLILEPDSLSLLGITLSALESMRPYSVFLDPQFLSLRNHVSGIKEAFGWLRMQRQTGTRIYFAGANEETWNAATQNLFRGPERVDIDVSNTCTHNCVFCGLYSPESLVNAKKKMDTQDWQKLTKMKSLRIDRERCLQLIKSLPDSLEMIQFGGMGDPLTHPDAMEFIVEAKKRGFSVEILSNFSYLTDVQIETLHEMSEPYGSIHFIVNLSAATAETYASVRPNQGAKSFERILNSIRLARGLAGHQKRGLRLTLMSVVNILNFHEMPDFVRLGHELNLEKVWLKPMELHGEDNQSVLIQNENHQKYKLKVIESLQMADVKRVEMCDRKVLEAIAHG
jgi:wyosine [tRNA(Phe)-imidazoG37] synthetase (radical SAM superfamily)